MTSYDTARIECGGGDIPCNREYMASWLDRIHQLTRGEHDPCGSTKIEKPDWTAPPTDHGRTVNPPGPPPVPNSVGAGFQEHDAKHRQGAFAGQGEHARQQQMSNKD